MDLGGLSMTNTRFCRVAKFLGLVTLVASAIQILSAGPAPAAEQSATPAPTQDRFVPARMNSLITKLQNGEVIVVGSVSNGSKELAPRDWDAVWFEMEHSGLDFPLLDLSLQYQMDPRRILEKGNLAPDVVPLTRIPVNGHESPDWLVKLALDAGVFGVIFPHTGSVEEAQRMIRATAYPPTKDSPNVAPELTGVRGLSPSGAMRRWGITSIEQYSKLAGVWPMDPQGNIMVIIIIEDVKGAKNLPQILKQVPVSAVLLGEVDLSASMGLAGQRFHPEVVATMDELAAICREHEVAFGGLVTPDNVAERVRAGWQILVTRDPKTIELGRAASAEMRNKN